MGFTTHELEILEKRARRAAQRREEDAYPEAILLTFTRAGASYGVPIDAVVSVAIIRDMTVLPGVSREFAGLLNIRGRLVTAIELAAFLGRPDPLIADAHRAVILSREGNLLAILAEDLTGVREVFAGESHTIEGSPAGAPIRTLTTDGLHIIETEVLLNDPRLNLWETP